MLMCLYTMDCTKREHSYFHCGQLMYQTILKKKTTTTKRANPFLKVSIFCANNQIANENLRIQIVIPS